MKLRRTDLARLVAVRLATAGIGLTVAWAALGVEPETLGVVVNELDPQSIEIAEYYARARSIPAENIIRVRLKASATVITAEEFDPVWSALHSGTNDRIEAYALTWAQPYRVACMSITAAFAFGFDERFCADGCRATANSPLFDTRTDHPYSDYSVRPSMAIAATTIESAQALIDRGLSSDSSQPEGTAYLLVTGDRARDIRALGYPQALAVAEGRIHAEFVEAAYLTERSDVLFYFLGARNVPEIGTNAFLPGAVADHLTSSGGALTATSQMSSLRWLEGGATGSYGTVVEPCNMREKFPNIAVFLEHYLEGETLIEAYWKSVAMPGQGIFIGEPLARPFADNRAGNDGQR